MGLAEGAEQVLDVMSHFVGDDVGISEVTVGADLLLHRREEREVKIDALVGAAVERAGLGSGAAATGLHRTGEEHEFRRFVGQAVLAEDLGPDVFRTGENLFREPGEFLFFGRRGVFARGLRTRTDYLTGFLNDRGRVAAQQPGEESDNDEAADTQAANGAHRRAAPAVVNVRAFASSFEFHDKNG